MPNGILIIDKPEGWTSMDVCAKLRGLFHERRVGHGGTLDPMATGVLPVFLGRATRAVSFVTDSEKEYVAGLQLGVITNTQDTTGEVLETRPVSVTREQLALILFNYVNRPETPSAELTFSDADSASAWSVDALKWAVGSGLISGKDNNMLDPQGTATRAEVAQIIANFIQAQQ